MNTLTMYAHMFQCCTHSLELSCSTQAAEELLLKLGALEQPPSLENEPPSITPLGRLMAHFPLLPRYAKLLSLGGQSGCMQYVIALVAALSVREVFADNIFHDNVVCCHGN